jgi:hypothetical protein
VPGGPSPSPRSGLTGGSPPAVVTLVAGVMRALVAGRVLVVAMLVAGVMRALVVSRVSTL